MSRRRKSGGHGGEHGPGMERWLLTYSDMITLLLALFVILFALSTINVRKFKLFEQGLSSAFNDKVLTTNSGGNGLLPKSNSLVPNAKTTSSTPVATVAQTHTGQASPALEKIAASVTQALQSAGLSQFASTQVEHHGVVIQMLADKTYYASDSATLGTTGDAVVDTIASVLRTIPNDVEVQGYTDNEPVLGGAYTSNWELSAVRAVNVVRRLVTVDGITRNRLTAVGFGSTHPIAPNTTTASRAQNRRVDVVILTSTPTIPNTSSAGGKVT
jgi:chemotaxis protein MotB